MGNGGIRRSGISAPGPSSDDWITKHRQLNPGVYENGASPSGPSRSGTTRAPASARWISWPIVGAAPRVSICAPSARSTLRRPGWNSRPSGQGSAAGRLRRPLRPRAPPGTASGARQRQRLGVHFNHRLYTWCQREGITFTRSRAYKKNDGAHVEQKNGAVVRRLIGYDRFASGRLCPARARLSARPPARELLSARGEACDEDA